MSKPKLGGLISIETMHAHRARWFVYSDGVRLPHTAQMRGYWPGWDVACSCGKWESKTGGAIKAFVQRELDDHRLDVEMGLGTS